MKTLFVYCSSLECSHRQQRERGKKVRDGLAMIEKSSEEAKRDKCPDCGHYLFFQRKPLESQKRRRNLK